MNGQKSHFQTSALNGLPRRAGRLLAGAVLLGGMACLALFSAGRPSAAELPSQAAKPVKPPAKKRLTAEEWRKLYPLESLTTRLDYEIQRLKAEPTPRPAPVLTAEAAKRLETMEKTGKELAVWNNVRAESLKILHSNQVESFVAREGFGVTRMPTPSLFYLEMRAAPPIPFTASGARVLPPDPSPKVALTKDGAARATGPAGTDARLPSLRQLDAFHLNGEGNFITPHSLGYVKDRDHVAGFQSHQFRDMPQLAEPPAKPGQPPKEKWAVARLELVSLLKHDKPAVYISEELPRMEQLKKAKTRPLDGFEEESLKRLQKGEDIVAEASLNHIRMMGSLRAAKQCLQCHSVRRGELLGTFSYELQRAPPIKAEK